MARMHNIERLASRPLISLIGAVLAYRLTERDRELIRQANALQPRRRNAFRRFFYRLHLRLDRACSWTERELTETRKLRDTFSKC